MIRADADCLVIETRSDAESGGGRVTRAIIVGDIHGGRWREGLKLRNERAAGVFVSHQKWIATNCSGHCVRQQRCLHPRRVRWRDVVIESHAQRVVAQSPKEHYVAANPVRSDRWF